MSNGENTSASEVTTPAKRGSCLSRLISVALGLILLVAAVLKSADMELFVRQMRDYGILSHHTLLILSAWGVIAVEFTLGVGLLVSYRPGLMLFLTAVLLLIFTAGASWAWLQGTAQDCGCFGAWLKHSPGQAALLNLGLLVGTLVAWLGCRHAKAARSRAKAWGTSLALVIGIGLPLAFGFSISRVTAPPPDTAGWPLGPLEVQGLGEMNLDFGDYLVVVMGTDCDHCQEAVPELNMLLDVPDLPPLVAVCTNNETERTSFSEAFQPLFPVGQISENDFWRLLGDGDMPRVMLVRDGRIVRVWDQTVPDEDILRKSLSVSDPTTGP